jgi:hypothetical protein
MDDDQDPRDPFADPDYDPLAPAPPRPWFGRRPYGYVYGPRTWQGWLIAGVLLVFAMLMISAAKDNGALVLAGVAPLVIVPLVIIRIQRR